MADRPADFTDAEVRLAKALLAALKRADPEGFFGSVYNEDMVVDGMPEEITIDCEVAPLVVARDLLETLQKSDL